MSLISVIIPVYNCDRYLSEAIKSVLNQTYKPLEIIIVDDGSTDKSAEIAKSFGDVIRYEFQSNSGLGATRNKGVELAKGDYLTFLDADDLWTENKLQLQIEAFNHNATLDMVFGNVQQFISPELLEELKAKIDLSLEFFKGYLAGTMMIKKESFNRVGYFSNNWELGEFIDWYLKAQEKKLQTLILPEILLKRRIHDTNMGIKKKDKLQDYVKIIKVSLDRKELKMS